jgi:imidazolonepropionase-like amidohydrolase
VSAAIETGALVESLDCDQLFDGRQVRAAVRVTIRDGTINEVTPIADADDPQPVVRAGFVMPGLIDAHVHATGYTEGLPAGAPFEPMKHFMRLCAATGVTTVRDTGNSLETLFYLRQWGEKFDGPRIVGAGPLLDNTPLTWMFSRIVRDEQSAQTTVDRLVDEGVDFIKAYRNITPALLRAIVSAAQRRNRYVASDSEQTPAIEAVRIGIKSLEHATNLLDDRMLSGSPAPADGMVGRARRWASVDLKSRHIDALVDALTEHETILVPTLRVSRRWVLLDEMVNEPHIDDMSPVMPYHRWLKSMRSPIGQRIGRRYMAKYMPVEALSRRDRSTVTSGLARMGELVSLLVSRGVTIGAGTDTPNPSIVPGFGLLGEIAELVAHGVAPLAALRAATADAALLVPDMRVGVVEPGCLADLCVVDGRPDQDVSHLDRITHVIKGGRVIDRERMLERVREAASNMARQD